MGPAIRQCEAAGQETSVTPASVATLGRRGNMGDREAERAEGQREGTQKGHAGPPLPLMPFTATLIIPQAMGLPPFLPSLPSTSLSVTPGVPALIQTY